MYLRGGNQKGEIPGSRSNIHVCLSWVLTRRRFKGLEVRGDRQGVGVGGGRYYDRRDCELQWNAYERSGAV